LHDVDNQAYAFAFSEFKKAEAAVQAEVRKAVRTVTPLAKIECRAFCSAIHVSLPLELRDMVYSFLIADEVIQVWASIKRGSNASFFKTPATDSSFYLKHGYSEPEVQKQMAEQWYRSATFRFEQLRLMTRFLSVNVWEGRFQPSELVRHIELTLQEDNMLDRIDLLRDNALYPLLSCRKGLTITIKVLRNDVHYALLFDPNAVQKRYRQLFAASWDGFEDLYNAGHIVRVVLPGACEFSSGYGSFSLESWLERLADV